MMSKMALLALGALALACLAGPALADGVNPPPRCHCHVVHHHHRAPPPPERVVYVPVPPPPCDGRWERDEDGHMNCVLPPVVEDIRLSSDFFADTGGVGPEAVMYEGGGGGGIVQAAASASAFASASASANVSIKFHGGHHMTPPPHGCGCSSHGKW
jgi:hypothetical protein